MLKVNDTVHSRYQLTQLLGANRAQTWLAYDLQIQRSVVLKVLSLAHLQQWKDQELFEREIAVLQQLEHPQVPRYYTHFHEPEQHRVCLVMEQVAGQSLADWLAAGNRCTPELLRTLATQALTLLHTLHGLNPPIVHRDIKPGNLIWDGETLHLVDFGGVLAHLNPVGGVTVTGTYGYMAPEQFAGKAQPVSDLYSLGATLVHLATGRSPTELLDEHMQLAVEPYVQLPPIWVAWLERLVAQRPDQRFASAREALMALQQIDTAHSPVSHQWLEVLAQRSAHSPIRAVRAGNTLTLYLPGFGTRVRHIFLMGWFLFVWLLLTGFTAGIHLWWLPGGAGLILLLISVRNIVASVREVELTPTTLTFYRYLFGLRWVRLQIKPEELQKLRWEGVAMANGLSADGYLELHTTSRQRIALGQYAALKENVWLYHLLLAWAEAYVPQAEAFCQASPDLAADPRYKHWQAAAGLPSQSPSLTNR
jgi:hypothetical protein